MKRVLIVAVWSVAAVVSWAVEPLHGLLERIDKGLSKKIVVEVVPDTIDYFELRQVGGRPAVRGNNRVSVAMGINWYLKYSAGVHLSWNCMTASLPDTLPPVTDAVRMSTDMPLRYYLNYCTHSYSMAFWNAERWQREVDWMALHGINMPLVITGTDAVWRRVLRRLGYPEEKIAKFIAGPGFQAWWLMNNLEGWGGPNTDAYYERQERLQQDILAQMRSMDMMPVMPGYSGMVPHDASEELGIPVADPGKWLGYTRPAFLQPTHPDFRRVAAVYYEEQQRMYGEVPFYSMDPFHEGGNTDGVDLDRAGRAIMQSLADAHPDARWVIQAWQENPRAAMIDSLPADKLLVLDLFAESRPQCGDSTSTWYRPNGFGQHPRLWCMLLNYGGNVGLHGKLQYIPDAFASARDAECSSPLVGVGLTMEGIENNPVMYELVSELPWRNGRVDYFQWLLGYISARYGRFSKDAAVAWSLLARSIYNCPGENTQQGTTESVFCARPSDNPVSASSWAESQPYYNPGDVILAARVMLNAADSLAGNANYLYDLVDIIRQAVAEAGRLTAADFAAAAKSGNKYRYADASRRFLRLIELQDSLLGTIADFRLGRWTEMARSCAETDMEKDRWEWNARVQITTWGNREASDRGGLHDYSHREWQGLLKDFYKPRWERWFSERLALWDSGKLPEIDFYAMEEPWTRLTNHYSPRPTGDPVAVARKVMDELDSLCN